MSDYKPLYDSEAGSDDTVLLKTESSRWSYVASKKGDPLFSSLVPDLPLEAIPDEIVISGEVAAILEEEYDSVRKLLDKMLTYKRANTASNLILNSMGLPQFSLYDVWITLYDIRRIRFIVDLPRGWESFVSVDERVDKREREYHIRMSKENMENADVYSTMLGGTRRAPMFVDVQPNDILTRVITIFDQREEHRNIAKFAIAHKRNGLLLSLVQQPTTRDSWKYVLWSDLYDLVNPMRAYATPDELAAITTIGMISGRSTEVTSDFTLALYRGNEGNDEFMELFHFMVERMSDDVPLPVIGLEHLPPSAHWQLIPITHLPNAVVMRAMTERKNGDDEALARTLHDQLGSVVVRKMMEALIHFAETTDDFSRKDKALDLATELSAYIR